MITYLGSKSLLVPTILRAMGGRVKHSSEATTVRLGGEEP